MRQIGANTLILILITSAVLAQKIPSPEEFLGFPIGADRELPEWQQMESYFKTLARESDRVVVQELGRSTNGNPFLLILISHPSSLAKLDHLQSLQQQLANPRSIDGSIKNIVAEAKTIVLATCAIHSTEVGSAQTAMATAYNLAQKTDPETEAILKNVIFLLIPSLNPDGIDIVHNWYRKTLGTIAEGTAPPELYHTYSGHDNNRDWYMFTQKETRLAIEKVHNAWHPQIVVDLHEMGSYGPRMFVPPFTDPIDPNVDPLLLGMIDELGEEVLTSLIRTGKSGIITRSIYDAYTPARAYQHYHAGARILLETASARLATPLYIKSTQLISGNDYDSRRASTNFPVPWRGGWWRIRDIIEHEQAALKAVLLHATHHREDWLKTFYQIGINAIQRTKPYAFILPSAQPDPQALLDLLSLLDMGMVEIHRAVEKFQVESSQHISSSTGSDERHHFPAGSYVILMQQPYSAFAKTMLEIQNYPKLQRYPGGPLKRPYDVTAHTLGIQLGVDTYQIDLPFEAELIPLDSIILPPTDIQGKGTYWLFSHSNNAFARLMNRLFKEKIPVYWAQNGFRSEGRGYPVGTLMAHFKKNESQFMKLLKDIPLGVSRVEKRPALAWQRVHSPKIGIYKSHFPSSDEGWTRWILEQYEFEYQSLLDSHIREGNLSSYDVIIVPHHSQEILKHGLGAPYPQEYRGGLGIQGIARLKQFSKEGGTLLFLGDSTELAISQWDLGIHDTTQHLHPKDFYVPGSLLRIQINNTHPVGYGMKKESAAMSLHNPAFNLNRGLAIANFPKQDLLLSGWITGAEHLAGKTAVAEIKLGKGTIILIPFRAQFRAQSRSTYKLVFNSLYYSTTHR
ncbi:MAG: M14 metallopeptidase family protein [Acidobacteriota bacterium]|nr:M14 metallopeptidase family protein [Acidobacteriota bacterium]